MPGSNIKSGGLMYIDTSEVVAAMNVMSPQSFDDMVDAAMRSAEPIIAGRIAKRYGEFTSSWSPKNQKVTINTKRMTWQNYKGFQVTTNSVPFVYVAIGRGWGIIRPKGDYSLKFVWGGYGSYKPATSPGSLSSSPSFSGGEMMGFRAVHHPGFVGRRPDETLVKEEAENIVNIVVTELMRELERRLDQIV